MILAYQADTIFLKNVFHSPSLSLFLSLSLSLFFHSNFSFHFITLSPTLYLSLTISLSLTCSILILSLSLFLSSSISFSVSIMFLSLSLPVYSIYSCQFLLFYVHFLLKKGHSERFSNIKKAAILKEHPIGTHYISSIITSITILWGSVTL